MFGTQKQVEEIVNNLEQPVENDVSTGKNGQEIANQLLGRDALKGIEDNKPAGKQDDLQAIIQKNNQIYEIHYYRDLVSSIPVLGKVIIILKKVVRRILFFLIQPMVDEQNAFNASVTQSLNGLNNEVQTNIGNIYQRELEIRELKKESGDLKELIDNQRLMIDEQRLLIVEQGKMALEQEKMALEQKKALEAANKQIEQNQKDAEAMLTMIQKLNDTTQLQNIQIKKMREDMEHQGAGTVTSIVSDAVGAIKTTLHGVADFAEHSKTGESETTYDAIDYASFENAFRGTQEQIRKAQEEYIGYFAGKDNVLDLGSGRGEFLELLKENGISAHGVDLYEDFVDLCREKGLEAVHGDAIEHLLKQEDNSLGGIFGAQLVEHLSPEQIVTICNAAYDKLQEGSCIILETPNPRCLSVYTNAFYIDPSHIKPVHPDTLKYYMEQAGFKDVQILYTESSKVPYELPLLNAQNVENLEEFNSGMNLLSDLIFGSQDYAVIARK